MDEIYIGYFDCCALAVVNEIEDGKPTNCPECNTPAEEIIRKEDDREH